MKLALSDRKILACLDQDARLPATIISKRTALPVHVVRYRLQKLLKTGIIKQFSTVLDIAKLQLSIHKCCYRLKNLTAEKYREIIEYCNAHNNVFWLSSSDGTFELSVAYMGQSLREINAYLRTFDDIYESYIRERKIVNILEGRFFNRTYLANILANKSDESTFGSVPQDYEIDSTDFAILHMLTKNARVSSKDIADRVHISQENVAHRIRRLRRNGIIQRFTIVLDAPKLKLQHIKYLLTLRNNTNVKQKALLDFCQSHPNVFFANQTLGEWDMEIDAEFEDVSGSREFVMELNRLFAEVISDYDMLHIYDVHKYNFLPMNKKYGK